MCGSGDTLKAELPWELGNLAWGGRSVRVYTELGDFPAGTEG